MGEASSSQAAAALPASEQPSLPPIAARDSLGPNNAGRETSSGAASAVGGDAAGAAGGGQSPSAAYVAALEGSSTHVSPAGAPRVVSPMGHSAVLDPTLLDGQVTIISNRGPLDDSDRSRGLAPLEVGRRLEGERLGQFVLKNFVGGGGMGAVFRALDTTLNREVAVKVLSRFQSDEEETLRRFRNEAQSAARLDHGNIARVYYVGFDRGLHYIVFEFIEGENMRDLVDRKGPLPVVEAVSYTLQIAEALTHASQRDVIHRDIKPSNVLVTPEGKAKLVDMGLARLHVDQPDQDITASGVTLGTFDYISPEQARDPRSADVRSDLYSLGCSLFFMLTGQPPFPHGTWLQKIVQHHGDEPPDARLRRPDLPTDVRRILNKLLAKDPDDRFQTPAELILDLIAAGRALGLQPPSSVNVDWTLPAERPVAWWEKHLPWFVPFAALVAIVAGMDYFWSGDESRAPADSVGSPAARAANVGPARPAGPRAKRGPQSSAAKHGGAADPAGADRDVRPRKFGAKNINKTPASLGKAAGGKALGGKAAGDEASGGKAAGGKERAGGATGRNAMPGDANRADRRATSAPPGEDSKLGRDSAKHGAGLANGPTGSGDSQAASTVASADAAHNGDGETNPMPMPGVAPGASLDEGAPATAPRQGLLIVGAADDRAPSFESLAAACAAAKSGDVIELRYSGVRDERPLWLSNIKLTIRAGERYAPIVRFRPAAGDVAVRERNMISLAGGQLSVINVRLEFDLPRPAVADEWALCAAHRAELLRFEHCVLTVRNAGFGQAAYSPGVAFFRVQAPSGAASLVNESALGGRTVELQLQNCVARGEATLLDVADGEDARLEWHNGFLATSERLLAVRTPPDSEQTGAVDVDLQHLTAVTRAGLVLLDGADQAGEPGPLAHITIADSIIALPTMATAPLVEQRIADRTVDFRSRLQWSGDRNFYQGFDVFWKVAPAGTDDALELSHAEWEAAWGEPREHLCSSGGVRWQALSAPSAPFDTMSAADYALLADSRLNPAVASASDGRDVGFLADSLPSVVAASATDSAATGALRAEGSTKENAPDDEP